MLEKFSTPAHHVDGVILDFSSCSYSVPSLYKKYNKEVLVIVGQALADFGACLRDHGVDGFAVKVISGGAA